MSRVDHAGAVIVVRVSVGRAWRATARVTVHRYDRAVTVALEAEVKLSPSFLFLLGENIKFIV